MNSERLVFSDPYVLGSKADHFGDLEIQFPRFESPALPGLIAAVRDRAKDVFEAASMEEIGNALNTVDAFFADPSHPEVRAIVDLIQRTDGFSRHDIEHFGLGVFARLVRYDRGLIGRFVAASFKTRRPVETACGFLQRFGTDTPFRRWREPEIVSHFVSGNVVGYSSILARIGFPIKSGRGAAQIIKLPSTSAVFPMLYLDKLKAVAPALRETIACGYWKGGDRQIEDVILAHSNAINILGAESTLKDVRARARRLCPRAAFLPHGHKIGAAYIARPFSDDPVLREHTMAGLVRDISAFDGAACYNTKNIYVQGDHRVFAERLFERLERFAETESPVSPAAKPIGQALRRIHLGSGDVLTSSRGNAIVRIRDKAEFWLPDEAYRYVQVMPIENETALAALLRKARPYLQTVVAAVSDEVLRAVLGLFGSAGASNIHYPGSAPLLNVYEEPHDGDFDFLKIRRPYRVRFAATNFKRNSDWLEAKGSS